MLLCFECLLVIVSTWGAYYATGLSENSTDRLLHDLHPGDFLWCRNEIKMKSKCDIWILFFHCWWKLSSLPYVSVTEDYVRGCHCRCGSWTPGTGFLRPTNKNCKFTCTQLCIYSPHSLLFKWRAITGISEEFAVLFFGIEETLPVVVLEITACYNYIYTFLTNDKWWP
jgi:hypothetical protein